MKTPGELAYEKHHRDRAERSRTTHAVTVPKTRRSWDAEGNEVRELTGELVATGEVVEIPVLPMIPWAELGPEVREAWERIASEEP